jgi:aminoglycoside phosphotransferase (APT) family kinase protein
MRRARAGHRKLYDKQSVQEFASQADLRWNEPSADRLGASSEWLLPNPRGKTWNAPRLALGRYRHWLNGAWRYNTSDMFTLSSSLKNYLRNEFARANGCERNRGCGPVEIPLRGAHSFVFFARAGDERRVVRMYPVSQQNSALNHKRALTLLAEHEVRAPRLIHYLADLPKYRAIFLTEEFVTGEVVPARKMDAARLEKIAVQLARLHSIRNSRWGPLGEEQRGGMVSRLRTRIRRLMETAVQEGLATREQARQAREWFQRWQRQLASPATYALLHGDLHPNNGLFTPDGDYCLIDFSKLNWGFAAKDIVRLRDRICGSDDGLFTAFEEKYLALLASEHREEYQRTKPFFLALNELESAAADTKREIRDSGIRRSEAPAESAARAWVQFSASLEQCPE